MTEKPKKKEVTESSPTFVDGVINAANRGFNEGINLSDKWTLERLRAIKVLPNLPIDNKFNEGYKACCDWVNYKIDIAIAEIKESEK